MLYVQTTESGLDIDLTAPFFVDAPEGIYVSEPYIEYYPRVITLGYYKK
ncbi:hypothetical protein [Shewanella sp. SR44-3]|nr:hypothetical protein [Shewanella sp. SR44-3]MBB1269616.1 hypothetical protein [Shewanella sp. SR44-3]